MCFDGLKKRKSEHLKGGKMKKERLEGLVLWSKKRGIGLFMETTGYHHQISHKKETSLYWIARKKRDREGNVDIAA